MQAFTASGGSPAHAGEATNRSVLRTVQAFAAGDAILAAAERVDAGDRGAAARLRDERAQLLARASQLLGEPLFAEDGKRLARLAAAVGGVSDALPLAILLRGRRAWPPAWPARAWCPG
jgi:hypothetical protein